MIDLNAFPHDEIDGHIVRLDDDPGVDFALGRSGALRRSGTDSERKVKTERQTAARGGGSDEKLAA